MPPRYTIIIPVAHFAEARPVLASLAALPPASGGQVLVAIGRHPARQRNAALAHAMGAIIVFLDNDCEIAAGYWDELERDFAQAGVEVIGGPARLRAEASSRERIFQALLSHPLVVGPLRARYAAFGALRRSSQTELILCNLAVRREVFEKIGHLAVELYPNEENEWLDRAAAAGVGIWYDPQLQVRRPQRETWGAMARTLVRYGVGRTKQFQVSRGRFSVHQLAPLVLLVPVGAAVLGGRGIALFGAGWLAVALLVGGSVRDDLSASERLITGLAAPFVPILYAWGQLIGWFRASPGAPGEITVVDGQNRPVA
jgi:succinoglycan biosynthesis protein ExoA